MHCDNCEKDITKHTKLYCPDSKVDVCDNCYSNGIQFRKHKSNEDYHVTNKLNFPLFVDD